MLAFLADAFVKATVLLLIAAGVTVLLRRSAAALRHLVWTLACTGVLALPVASVVIPDWGVDAWPRLDVPAPLPFAAQQVAQDDRLQASPTAATSATVQRPAPTPAAVDTEPVRWQLRPDWTTLILPLWLIGAAFVLLALAIGLIRVAWLGRTASPVTDPAWLQLARELERGLGIERPVRLLRTSGPAMPMTWGVRRPVVLLPAEADEWPEERRRDVLLHELAHVKRQDFLTQLIARIACAVYWFHPLVWLAAARLRVERERACDDHVLRAGTKPSAYASHLLEIARALRAAPATSVASVAMARPAQLATRLLDVLDARRCRDTVSPRAAVPAWVAAIAVVVPLAAAAPRVTPPEKAKTPDPVLTRPEPASRSSVLLGVPQRIVRPAMHPVDTLPGCTAGEGLRGRSSHTRVENENLTISVTAGGCVVRLEADGEFTFTADFTDIATVPRGGQVMIEVDYGARDRRVTIRRAEGGGLEKIYKVDGDVRPFDAEAQAWLTQTITYLLRRSGYAAKERATWILEHRGIQGLLDEFAHLGSDYSRRIYYQAAVESGKMDVAAYERLINDAARTISSDYELAELLIAVTKTQALNEGMQTGFVAAAKTISSDYERRRVLQAALSRQGLTAGVQSGMLEAAAEIRSDYELAELLIQLNGARRIDDAVRPAFFQAANSLQSDYEHRRVLSAVVGRAGASRAILADALESAKTIQSDYELAELLTGVATAYVVEETLRPAFFAAAGTIDSDYEHSRTLTSLLRGEVSRPVALGVIESARTISSDYHLAEVLLAVIEKVKIDEGIETAIRSVGGALRSNYERGRVREALARRTGRTELD